LLATGLSLVACGNEGDGSRPQPAADATETSATPSITPTTTSSSTTPASSTTPERSVPEVAGTPTVVPAQLSGRMLLTGTEVAKADPNRGWIETKTDGRPICGPTSTRGNGVRGSLARQFTTELDALGGQWLTRYQSPAVAEAAYDRIVATIKSCNSLTPAPTHARKLTESRTLPLGDATTILRWYDYPLPTDPGSEPGGFPYAVTRKGSIVSVLAFREMGAGVAPAHFEALTRTAAARLG